MMSQSTGQSEQDEVSPGPLETSFPFGASNTEQHPKHTNEVREMRQKGLGLSTLRKALSVLSETASLPHSTIKKLSQTERQKLLETNTFDAALDRWREEDARLRTMGVKSGLSNASVGAMLWKWHETLLPLVKDDIRKSQEAEQRKEGPKAGEDSLTWGPYLQMLSPEKVSAITILVAMRLCSPRPKGEQSGKIANLVYSIGEAVQNESIAEAIRTNRNNKDLRKIANLVNARSGNESLTKLLRRSASREHSKLEWNGSMKVKLGAILLSHLMEIAKIPVSKEDPKTGLQVQDIQPVFFHTFKYVAGKRIGVVQLNAVIIEKLCKEPVATTLAKYLPMICKPKPWVGFAEGGFLEAPLPVIRLSPGDSQARRYARTATENGDMVQIFAGLDVLARTPWNINRFVFDTMLEVWNSGQALAKIPPEDPPMKENPEPPPSDSPRERAKWFRRIREIENHKAGLKSQRCFQNFQMEVARAYLNDTFYFPHNCDFRGRAYPMTPFLNHMGSDNVRGLLLFAQGKELTTKGLWWLKVHLANVFGYDKASFTERLEFTETHLPDIRDSVNKPLTGEKWWLKAEDPWQCLAACKELKDALDSPDPSKYVCKLPIHQDGTCNGLQHYAALGGDAAGAEQVNLEPGPRPSDIYTGVAELAKAEIAEEAAAGDEMAKAIVGKVTRKVVKQTVMTNVYGVTFHGAQRQVRRQLEDLYPMTSEFDPRFAAPYIVKKIFAALAGLFNGAHDIQHWLTDCAGRISDSLAPEQVAYIGKVAQGHRESNPYKRTPLPGGSKTELTDFKSTVIWTTPLKMPVVQPYRKQGTQRVETNLQQITIRSRSTANPVHKGKQIQAFPPNFIHSLDATHMFLTALKCDEIGLTFAAIHDSFWTHAGDVDVMNRVIRDAFVRMHTEDIIGRLGAEFKARYKDHMQLASIRLDFPVAKKIEEWRRKSKKEAGKAGSKDSQARKWHELIMERHRLDLLASEDPKKREEGQRMETAGKIFADIADEKSLAPTEIQAVTLGLSLSSRTSKLKANHQLEVGDVENAMPLEPAMNDDDAINAENEVAASDPADDVEEDLEEELGEETRLSTDVDGEVHGEGKPKKRKQIKKTWVWLPLTFPPVPKKVSVPQRLPRSRGVAC